MSNDLEALKVSIIDCTKYYVKTLEQIESQSFFCVIMIFSSHL